MRPSVRGSVDPVFLKWAGGKRRLLPALDEVFPPTFGTYFEPFVGAGAVFFHLAAAGRLQAAELSDLNADLVRTFEVVRDDTKQLMKELRPLVFEHTDANYYAARERFNRPGLSPVRRAAHLIYLNKTGFNGLYRVNSRGEFNVPVGRYANPRVFAPKVLERAASLLQRARVHARDFEQATEHAKPGDLVYFDPPYDPLSATASFTGYAGGFGVAEQERLRQVFGSLDERGVYVVLSNHDTPLVARLYAGYETRTEQVARPINSNAQRRRDAAPEVIVIGHTLAKIHSRRSRTAARVDRNRRKNHEAIEETDAPC